MGSGKHETTFVHELAPFVLFDRTNKCYTTHDDTARYAPNARRMHVLECDQLEMIRNGARMHAALWHGSIRDHDMVMIELQQCRDVRKRRMLQYSIDRINTTIEMHERNAELCQIALECAIDNAYMHACGTLECSESIIPVWYWSII